MHGAKTPVQRILGPTVQFPLDYCIRRLFATMDKGASPLLFGGFLMNLAAFVSLEDISDALPPYEEEVISVALDPVLREAYA